MKVLDVSRQRVARMTMFSYMFHGERTILTISLWWTLLAALLGGCYSFRGGSVPDHLKTVSISSVVDQSGFGDATFRDFATETLVRRFRSDNALQVVDDDGDARIIPVIVRIQDRSQNVQGDLEGQRRLVVVVEVEYVDAVKNRTVWRRTFENFDVYDALNAATDRPRAAREALQRIVDDILLAVVSDW